MPRRLGAALPVRCPACLLGLLGRRLGSAIGTRPGGRRRLGGRAPAERTVSARRSSAWSTATRSRSRSTAATEDVRYIGVDTPETVKPGEPVECYGPQASEFNHELVEGADGAARVRRRAARRLRPAARLRLRRASGSSTPSWSRGGFARTLEIEPNTSRARPARAARGGERGTPGEGLWGAC